MVKALFNRYQDEIVIGIWIIGIIISIFLFTNGEKCHIIPGSVVQGTYDDRPITYYKYIYNGKEGYLGFSNNTVHYCGAGCAGHTNDVFSKKAIRGNWNRIKKRGYFTINNNWGLGFIPITCCFVLMGIVYLSTNKRWREDYYKVIPKFGDVNHRCLYQNHRKEGTKYVYYCGSCGVKDYCKYSDDPNKVFQYIRIYKNKFLGY